MSVPVNLSFGQLPTGYCMTSFVQLATDILSLLSGSLPGTFTGVVQGPDKPQVSDQDKLWIKTDASGNPIGQYLFSNGSWVWPHPVAPGDPCIRPFLTNSANTPADVFSYDGGDGTDPAVTLPTLTSGAMWTIVGRTVALPYGSMQVATPIGVGTLTNPDGTTTTQIVEGQTGGEAVHALLPSETWHQHGVGRVSLDTGNGYSYMTLENGGSQTGGGAGTLTAGTPGTTVKQACPVLGTNVTDVTSPSGWNFETDVPAPADIINTSQPSGAPTKASVSHNNLQPFAAVYWIQRTARAYYVGG